MDSDAAAPPSGFDRAINPANMAKRSRTERIDVAFTGPNRTAAGWAWAVPQCFADALDIKFTDFLSEKKLISAWTRGLPPEIQFSAGDMIHDNAAAISAPWGSIERLRSLHVRSATPDRFEGDSWCFGMVQAELLEWRHAEIMARHAVVLPQANFAEFLRLDDLAEVQGVHPAYVGIPRERRRGRPLLLHYRGDNGTETRRFILALGTTERRGRLILRAYCRLRGTFREFVALRILELVDVITGEVVERPADIEALLRALPPPAEAGDLIETA